MAMHLYLKREWLAVHIEKWRGMEGPKEGL